MSVKCNLKFFYIKNRTKLLPGPNPVIKCVDGVGEKDGSLTSLSYPVSRLYKGRLKFLSYTSKRLITVQ